MSDITKTSIFVLLAAALVGGAILSRPTARDFQAEEMLGQTLFPQFNDPLDINSLEIVRQNAAGERDDFRIAAVNGIWSIPSHDNYPADARDQMGRVAETLTDLKVLEVIQPDAGLDAIAFQTQYGVIDPTSETASFGDGVGLKITLLGANNETLVNLIVGNAVASHRQQDLMADETEKLRYVRIANQSPVYVVNVDASQFSTNFDQWIERNLLDISTFDIKEFFVDQYSFSVDYALTSRGLQEILRASLIGDITLGYDASAVGPDKWSLLRWMTFEGQNHDYREQQLAANQELNTDTLDAMVAALNDLRIVSVLKKPASLAAALREEQAFENIERDAAMQESMQRTGFWLDEIPDLKGGTGESKTQLLSNRGDLQIRLKDGIVYNLRFGDLTGTESEMMLDGDSPDIATPVMGANRYLFITAEFDASIIPLPELREVPEDVADGEAAGLFNQREQERYDGELERGLRRAAELSARFADWYYVIAEDVYRQIHLTEANVFRVALPDWNALPDLPEFVLPEPDM